MTTIEELVEALPRLRAAHRLTQEQLAELVGVTQPTVCDWERGRKLPSRRNEARIRGVFANAAAGRAA